MLKKLFLPEERREKYPYPIIEKKEFLWVILLGFLASFLSLAPTILAYLETPSGFWFAGFNVLFNPWDINTYFANIRQGINGYWLYHNPYLTIPSPPLPVYLPYLFLGHLARIFSLPVPIIYHLSAIFLTPLLFLVIYVLISFFLKERKIRLLTLCLVVFGGGIGWMFFPENLYLADFSFPDATIFPSLNFPHFILNQTLFLATLLLSFLSFLYRKIKFSFLASAAGFLLAFIHPYSLFVIFFIFLGYLLLFFLKRRSLGGIIYFFPQFFFWGLTLAVFYYFLRDSAGLYIQEMRTPEAILMVLSYGILSPLALVGAVILWRRGDAKSLFLFSWLVFHSLALYLPFSFQRHFVKSFFVIICLSAVLGVKKLVGYLKNPWPVYFWFFTFSIFSQIVAIVVLLYIAGKTSTQWVYLRIEEKKAFDFLLNNSQMNEGVLTSYRIGNFLPANTNNRVYLGHNMLSSNYEEKKERTESFYSGRLDVPSYQFLKNEKINYVFWGPEEKSLGDFDLTKESYLEKIYENEKVIIFKVK